MAVQCKIDVNRITTNLKHGVKLRYTKCNLSKIEQKTGIVKKYLKSKFYLMIMIKTMELN